MHSALKQPDLARANGSATQAYEEKIVSGIYCSLLCFLSVFAPGSVEISVSSPSAVRREGKEIYTMHVSRKRFLL